MIEILELKNSTEKNTKEMSDDNLRRFIFRDGKRTLGSLQLKLIHPQVASLLKLETTETSELTEDVIVDGLIRTACHTFQIENIPFIAVEGKTADEHVLLTKYFTPLDKISEAAIDEKMTMMINDHHQGYLLKTDMIYQGCCKGV